MLNNITVTKLREMRLNTMADAFLRQQNKSGISELSFDDRFGFIVDEEYTARENNRHKNLIRNAGYPCSASLEGIEYHADRNLDKSLILRLGTCNYIAEHHNVIIQGATGSGKTYIACALGEAANRQLYSVKYVRLPDLLIELHTARAENSYGKLMTSYMKYKLLILDEWLLYPLAETAARDVLELVERRYKKASSIFCSQFIIAGWHEKIGDALLSDAVCDRIVHDSYTLTVNGDESMRKRKGIDSSLTI
jgi:DNA replication protein DnaC